MTEGTAENKKSRWYLEKVTRMQTTWAVPIDPIPFTIGRDSDCDLTLRSKWVSRHHARIHLSGEILWIHDLGSTNGTLLNQKQIKEAELLEIGDHLHFGDHQFVVQGADDVKAVITDETMAFDSMDNRHHAYAQESMLEKIMTNRIVVPHFQPIVAYPEGRVMGYEILGRIKKNGLPESPVELFSIASNMGRAAQLSAIFREEGMRLGEILDDNIALFINTHPIEIFEMEALVKSLREIRQMAASRPIVLEINETAVTKAEQMKRLRALLTELNLELAYDDFGVGQTRLVELAKLPPNYLKFDMSIIRDIHIAPKRLHHIILTFMKAAEELGIKTLAEGIECLEEEKVCQKLGFGYSQGYYYGRPMPITDLPQTTD